jgi:hypothetical protein
MTYISYFFKIGWFTADNTTNNDMAIKAVGAIIDPSGEE